MESAINHGRKDENNYVNEKLSVETYLFPELTLFFNLIYAWNLFEFPAFLIWLELGFNYDRKIVIKNVRNNVWIKFKSNLKMSKEHRRISYDSSNHILFFSEAQNHTLVFPEFIFVILPCECVYCVDMYLKDYKHNSNSISRSPFWSSSSKYQVCLNFDFQWI